MEVKGGESLQRLSQNVVERKTERKIKTWFKYGATCDFKTSLGEESQETLPVSTRGVIRPPCNSQWQWIAKGSAEAAPNAGGMPFDAICLH